MSAENPVRVSRDRFAALTILGMGALFVPKLPYESKENKITNTVTGEVIVQPNQLHLIGRYALAGFFSELYALTGGDKISRRMVIRNIPIATTAGAIGGVVLIAMGMNPLDLSQPQQVDSRNPEPKNPPKHVPILPPAPEDYPNL